MNEVNYQVIEVISGIARSFVNETQPNRVLLDRLNNLPQEKLLESLSNNKLVLISNFVLNPVHSEIRDDLIQPIIKRSKQLVLRNMALLRESIKLVSFLKEKGVCIIPYKGINFGNLYYSSLSLRHSVDIDFAIYLDDLLKCRDLMMSLDYQEVKGGLNNTNIKSSRAFYLDYPWQKEHKSGINLIVEFHLAPAHKALYIPLDFSQYQKSNTGSDIEKGSFTKVEHALFIIIHHGAVDLWGKLMHLVDLNQILIKLDDDQLNELLQLCDKNRIRKFLELGISMCENIFEKKYNVPRRYSITENRLKQFQKDLLNGKLSGRWSENKVKLWYHFQFRDSKIDQLKLIKSLGRYGIFSVTGN